MYFKNKYNIANTYKSFVRYIKIYRKYVLVDLYKYETKGAFYTEKEIDDLLNNINNNNYHANPQQQLINGTINNNIIPTKQNKPEKKNNIVQNNHQKCKIIFYNIIIR